jgi:hypothetical protein
MIGDGDRSQYFLRSAQQLGKAYLAWLLRDMQLLGVVCAYSVKGCFRTRNECVDHDKEEQQEIKKKG